MRPVIITLAAVATTGALATAALAARTEATGLGPAPAAGTGLPSGQCIRSNEIRNHTFADDRTMLIDVRGRDTYRVTMSGSCLAGAMSSDPIVTRSPPGSTLICKPIDMDVAVSRAGFPSPCIVESIVKLSAAEVAALPKKLKP
ncbi:DUF6491 family protein [Phenylobacterium sp.]|uniref:DUF6491 family protein n=1 Tax=Phenylobacterium sp. TaxID=1871053 RepID=UPI0025FBEB2F|nr:DUF6491 family protein [Phenylobacterium sp.]MBX3483437.1 hypothetical protein [Phenylobacterium sp.]MCW5760726.1 hypothetical protein [Phenylobacterium sp.]